MVRVEGGRQLRVSVPVGLVVTDRRIVFTALDSGDGDAGSLAYDEVAGIEERDGGLVFTTTDGIVWRFPLADADTEPVDIAVRHLRWIGRVRNRVVGMENDVQLAAGKILSQVDDLDWEGATETYRKSRRQLDDLVVTVGLTTPLSADVLAPELTEIEHELESACVRLHIERARSLLELGRQLVGDLEYEGARTALADAYERYERAKAHRDEVERADSFQFGQQRELTRELEELAWEIESAAGEPLQQAAETKTEAREADDLERSVELWETAFRRYHGVLDLEWDDQRHFAGDPEMIRDELDGIADRLIDLHERAAQERWNEGARLEADGQLRDAIRECGAALDHLERVHDLAEDFDPKQVREFENQLKEMFETFLELRSLRRSRHAPESEPADSEATAFDADDFDGDLSLEDLSRMDTHQEITINLEGGDLDELREREWAHESPAGSDTGEDEEAESGRTKPTE